MNEWLDNLIEELELESFKNDIDITEFIEDMTNDEWENVWNDVINNFDSNLFPQTGHFFSPRCICLIFFVKQQQQQQLVYIF